MPEPIEVEVVLPIRGVGCPECTEEGPIRATLAPGSLSEAYYRLGVAAEVVDDASKAAPAPRGNSVGIFIADDALIAAENAYYAALAAVRRLKEGAARGSCG